MVGSKECRWAEMVGECCKETQVGRGKTDESQSGQAWMQAAGVLGTVNQQTQVRG